MWFKKSILLSLLAIGLFSCENESEEELFLNETTSLYSINLHWYKNDIETREEFETGLRWCFLYLGANLETGSWNRGAKWAEDQKIQLDVNEFGFNTNAVNNLKILIDLYKGSEEYNVTGGIDAGRFVACILNNSNHYYKIVGMPLTLESFNSNYNFLKKRAAIIESAVAFEERLIHMPESDETINSLGYWAQELSGSLVDSSHKVEENEVMDVMPNGQIRFGIYNRNGQLINGADPTISVAGKPVKCLWCHEVNIQRGFVALTAIPGYFSPNQFDSIVNTNRTTLSNYRMGLSQEIDFYDRPQHAELEKLYFRFFEPSAKRLAEEWGLTEEEVTKKLEGIPTHQHHEFTELGEIYDRADVEQFSPYQVLKGALTVRETIVNEPDYLP